MLNSFVNSKNIHRAMQTTTDDFVLPQATVDPYETAMDSGMDFIEPETPEPEYWGNNRGCFEESAVTKTSGLARAERKFGVQVIGVLDKKRVNGFYRCKLLCLNGSVLDDDISPEELEALPELRKTSAVKEWESGGYPIDPPMELALFKEKNKDKLSSCVLCDIILLHPKSTKRHICPECFSNISLYGLTFVEGETVGQCLMQASENYSEEQFQKWLIKAVLLLDAPVPEATLEWKGKEFFGYEYKPALYYLDRDGKLNCVEVNKKKLTHRKITEETCGNDLDRQAWKMANQQVNLEIEEVICHSPYIKGQWFIKDGRRRISVYWEINGKLWCNCRKENCRHILALRDSEKSTHVAGSLVPQITTRPLREEKKSNDGGDNPPSSIPSTPVDDDDMVADEKPIAACSICGRTLTNKLSISRCVGPECFKEVGAQGTQFLRDDEVSDELIEASKLYHDNAHGKRIIKACLALDAPLPAKVLTWQGNQYWSYKKSPLLYYLDRDGKLNCVDTYKRKLRHRIVTKDAGEADRARTSGLLTELDSHAIRLALERASETNGNGGRTLQMDQKLRTWLVESNGAKKEIPCSEICEQFKDGSIVTRLRAGIDSGADISTVELDA